MKVPKVDFVLGKGAWRSVLHTMRSSMLRLSCGCQTHIRSVSRTGEAWVFCSVTVYAIAEVSYTNMRTLRAPLKGSPCRLLCRYIGRAHRTTCKMESDQPQRSRDRRAESYGETHWSQLHARPPVVFVLPFSLARLATSWLRRSRQLSACTLVLSSYTLIRKRT